MYEISEKVLKYAYRPYDIVADKNGNVGFIQEVDLNCCQPKEEDQLSYCVQWLVGKGDKNAWYKHKELTRHCNLFVKIAECSCGRIGDSRHNVEKLMSLGI